jgi:SulP family sulfate permease
LLGFFRLGNLIKYIPHTVLSGFLNGIAILLVWKQLPLLLGLSPETDLAQVFNTPDVLNRASLLVGLAALGAVFVSKSFFKRLPSLVVGLAAGIAACGLLPLLSLDTTHVATVGDLSAAAPTTAVFHELLAQLPRVLHYDGIYDLCGYGVVLGMLGAMESLMSSSALEGISDTRADSNRELVGQGLGNLVASLFGAIASAGSIIRSHANVRAGGRGRLSGAFCSAVMLFSVWAIAPLIGKISLVISQRLRVRSQEVRMLADN